MTTMFTPLFQLMGGDTTSEDANTTETNESVTQLEDKRRSSSSTSRGEPKVSSDKLEEGQRKEQEERRKRNEHTAPTSLRIAPETVDEFVLQRMHQSVLAKYGNTSIKSKEESARKGRSLSPARRGTNEMPNFNWKAFRIGVELGEDKTQEAFKLGLEAGVLKEQQRREAKKAAVEVAKEAAKTPKEKKQDALRERARKERGRLAASTGQLPNMNSRGSRSKSPMVSSTNSANSRRRDQDDMSASTRRSDPDSRRKRSPKRSTSN